MRERGKRDSNKKCKFRGFKMNFLCSLKVFAFSSIEKIFKTFSFGLNISKLPSPIPLHINNISDTSADFLVLGFFHVVVVQSPGSLSK